MHLYTESYSVTSAVTINANDVNYSDMPTCAMQQYTRPDVGIWAVEKLRVIPWISKLMAAHGTDFHSSV